VVGRDSGIVTSGPVRWSGIPSHDN